MSPSEPATSEPATRFAAALGDLAGLADHLAERGEAVADADLRQLVTLAVRLYAAAVDRGGGEPVPTDRTISTTEAVTLAVALLRQQNLNAFDTALWFSRTAPQG